MNWTTTFSDKIVLTMGDSISKARVSDCDGQLGSVRIYNYYNNKAYSPRYYNNIIEWANALGWDPKTTRLSFTHDSFEGLPTTTVFPLADLFGKAVQKAKPTTVADDDDGSEKLVLTYQGNTAKVRRLPIARNKFFCYRLNGKRSPFRSYNTLSEIIAQLGWSADETTITSADNAQPEPLSIPPVPKAVLAAFNRGDSNGRIDRDNENFLSEADLEEGEVLRAYFGEEHVGSARVANNDKGVPRLYAYNRDGRHLGQNSKNYIDSVQSWLNSFDYDSYKIGIKLNGEDRYTNIVA